MTKPWFRQYRREEGSFAQLPLYVRALAGEILKLTDDDGVIQIGRKEPWEAIAFALGATAGERRMLRRDVAVLLEDGFLVHEGTTLRAPNFPRFQTDDAAAGRARDKHESSTSHERTENEPCTSGARVVHETEAKSSETHEPARPHIREDKSREEENIDMSGSAEPNPGSVTELRPRKAAKANPEADRVFAAWLEEHVESSRRAVAKFNAERRKVVEARLREGYSADRLIAALRGVKRVPHYMGQNETGTKYTDLVNVLRNGERVERFEALANGPAPIPMKPAVTKGPMGQGRMVY